MNKQTNEKKKKKETKFLFTLFPSCFCFHPGLRKFLDNPDTALRDFDYIEKETLKRFFEEWNRVVTFVRESPPSRTEFEKTIRGLGICAVLIFGNKVMIPSLVGMIHFLGSYLQEAENLARDLGIPLNLSHFDDGIFEQGHQLAKLGTIRPSSSDLSNISSGNNDLLWQEGILWQQLSNVVLHWDAEQNSRRSLKEKLAAQVRRKEKHLEEQLPEGDEPSAHYPKPFKTPKHPDDSDSESEEEKEKEENEPEEDEYDEDDGYAVQYEIGRAHV